MANTTSYLQAFDRIRAEYLEMPGMRLTPAQVQRLCGVDAAICKWVLDDLVRAQFLYAGDDGGYARDTGHPSLRRTTGGDWNTPTLPTSRRAG
jgi:hypothetical protein